MWNARLDESQAGIKISGRNINNLSYADDTTLMKKMKRNKRPSWWEWKKRVKKLAWNSHSKAKIMASSPITSWQMEGKKVEMVTDFIFLGSKITVDVDYSHEIKRCLLLGRKVMTNLDSVWKSRDITLLTKVHIIKTMVFSVVMYRCESGTIGKLSTKELMHLNCCAGGLLRVPWTSRRSN